ncbi:sulfite oxidase subunit YedZ [Acetobacter estunensis NRIC 0472]|uniref:Protein-methionine-sulfoxide reductase heme-binding subunit MsrQ n=1 Tax=Acetobacter estunensis TaxID=104097 RepID=A0A967B650_9PROT|nr:protein-methionine-sulfoxide reductase heme-binding subunit MsrQ [Acetobacter estunensis]NHO52916.1 sulfoxide reductase heme-binding subunit YedZ [Acetobacter estunensis]GBQ23353.1 sulfite oxidase subunit YedZ [Acetobacter estunensis NRIC 0472]
MKARNRRQRFLSRPVEECLVWLLFLVPAASEWWAARTGELGAHPVTQAEKDLGLWAFRFLLLTLAITPLRRYARIDLMKWRRVAGLLAFTYAVLHVGVYAVGERQGDLARILHDLANRLFLPFGLAAFLILLALAVTSQQFSMKLLGRRWRILHRGIYAAAILVTVHDLLGHKHWLGAPLVYAFIACGLVAMRSVRRPPVRLL